MSNASDEKKPIEMMDTKDLLLMIRHRKWTMVISSVAVLLLGIIICLARVPAYQSNLLINVNTSSNSGLISSILGQQSSALDLLGGGASGGAIATEQSIVTSRSVLIPTIQTLHLDVSVTPAYFPIFGHHIAQKYDLKNYTAQVAKPWFGMNKYNWGGSSINVKQFSVGPYWQDKKFTLIYQGNNTYQLLSPKGAILATGKTGTPLLLNPNAYNSIVLTITAIQANTGAAFYLQQNNMQKTLKALSAKIGVAPTGQFSTLLSISLQGSNPQEIALTLNTIGHYILKSSIQQTVMQASETLSFLKARVPTAEKNLALAESQLAQYSTQTGHVSLPVQTKLLLSKIAETQAQLNQAQLQKTQLEAQYTDSSLPIQEIVTAIQQYQQQLDTLQKQLLTIPNADQKLVDLTRAAKIQSVIYTNLLENIQKYELIKASTLGNVTIIDHANVPFISISVPSPLIFFISLIIGILLGAIIILLQNFLRKNIQDISIIEQDLRLPVIATILDSQDQRRQKRRFDKKLQPELQMMNEIDSQSLISESIRSLRTHILFKLHSQKGNIITISGPAPGIGKSFVSTNLASALAEAGKRVLLIDADLRRGDLYHYFNCPHTPGLTEILQGTETTQACVKKTRFTNLDFLPTGSGTHNHTELLLSPFLEATIKALSIQYDILIIDTAPILALTDATIIGQYATLRLLVLGYGKHTEKELETAVSQFHKVGQWIHGCIFNLIPEQSSVYQSKTNFYKYNYRSKKNK